MNDISGWYQNRQDGYWQREKQRRQIWHWNVSRNTMSVALDYLEEDMLSRMQTFWRTRCRRNRKGSRASRVQNWRNRKSITKWKKKLRICWIVIQRIHFNKKFEVKDESYWIFHQNKKKFFYQLFIIYNTP